MIDYVVEPKAHESLLDLRHRAQDAVATGHVRSETTPELPIVKRVIRRYRARLFQWYVVAAMVAFAILFFAAREVAYFPFDLYLANWVQRWNTLWLDIVMVAVSQLGFNPMGPIVVVLTVAVTYRIGLKWETIMLIMASAGVGILSTGFKVLAQRARPTSDLVNVFSELSDYSFPSGHVLLFTAFLGFVAFLIYTLMLPSWVRTVSLTILGALILLVGISRVYLGHHWPSDVFGAYLLGSLWLAMTIFLYRKGKRRFFVHQPVAPGRAPDVFRADA